jgi:hypothetical protein
MWGSSTINATKLSADLYGYEVLFLVLCANKISSNVICPLLSHYSAHKCTVLHKNTIFKSLLQRILSTVAQSVQRLTTGWMVQNRIPVGTRFSAHPDRPWDPLSLLYKEYRVFPGGKVRPGRAADHSPPSSALAMEQWSYTSTHPLDHTGPITGTHYLFTAMNYASFTQCIVICFTNHTKKMHKVYSFEI